MWSDLVQRRWGGHAGPIRDYQRQVSANGERPIPQNVPVRGWSWHHYVDYGEWDQGLTVNGYLNTRKPAFDWVRDNLVNRTPPHTYEGR